LFELARRFDILGYAVLCSTQAIGDQMRHLPFKVTGLFIFLFSMVGLSLSDSTLAHDIAGVWECTLRSQPKNESVRGGLIQKKPAKSVWSGGLIRFYLSLEKQNDQWKAFFVNGNERIEVPTVKVNGDQIKLRVDHYDSELSFRLVPAGDIWPHHFNGTWKKRRGKDNWVEMTFYGQRSDNWARSSKLTKSFDGTWKVKFEKSEDPAVGVFKMDPTTKRIDGTFLTTTGDYRFLSGFVLGKEGKTIADSGPSENLWHETMSLSCFDGAHAFQFQARLDGMGGLVGDFWSSNTWHETWTAQRDPNAKLPDDFKQTKLVEGETLQSLVFPDLKGNPTSVGDKMFAAPVRLVHVFGSWCPNCHDAGVYLAELKKKYGDKVSVVGLAFELTGDHKRDSAQVKKYLERYELDHPVLIAGLSDKKLASKAIPLLDRVRSYPTTIFADADGKVIAIHTGFTGPATGKAYTELKTKFESTIDSILKNAKVNED